MKMTKQAPACTSSHYRNHCTGIAEQVPMRSGAGSVHPPLPDTTHESPALQADIRAVLNIVGACQRMVQARFELFTCRGHRDRWSRLLPGSAPQRLTSRAMEAPLAADATPGVTGTHRREPFS